jgi:uncharacterized protein YndB with AHSA1/START domain
VSERVIVRVDRRVSAPPAAVYAFLTESDRWASWQGAEATIEPRPGGLFLMRMGTGETARGQFVELIPERRVVFTWGWVDAPGVPPGSTTVEIELLPDGDGTMVRLTHKELPADDAPTHETGWRHYLARLEQRAEGLDPGPDPGPGPQTAILMALRVA